MDICDNIYTGLDSLFVCHHWEQEFPIVACLCYVKPTSPVDHLLLIFSTTAHTLLA